MATYPIDWRADLLGHARTQRRALFQSMCDGSRWHLWRVPGTTSVAILRDGAPQDTPLSLLVPNVHACDEQTMLARAQNALDR